MTKRAKPKPNLPPVEHYLVGRAFTIHTESGEVQYQGIVRAKLDDRNYLVQLFEALMGEPGTMAVVSIDTMLSSREIGRVRHGEGWQFYENDTHLRWWMEQVYKPPRDDAS